MNYTPLPEDILADLEVLVVEDEAMLFFLAEDMLASLGATAIQHASRVDEALRMLDAYRPDVAMLDVNLAGEPVYRVAERLARDKVPFIFATGYGVEGIRGEWASYPIVQKPYTASMLSRALQEALASGD